MDRLGLSKILKGEKKNTTQEKEQIHFKRELQISD